jgi:glutamate synthase (NADPH/NADH) small chain
MAAKFDNITAKERISIPRQSMPQQEGDKRIRNFNEVPLGYTARQAITEANRCIQCKKPTCIDGCPVHINIPEFIGFIAQSEFVHSIESMKKYNMLPAICGRVCPQEEQCEATCVLGKRGDPVAIGRLERFIADWERDGGKSVMPDLAPSSGKRVAVVGSGPAGLTVAADLKRFGHHVTIFEAFHAPGGVLTYGIPEFRLPKSIVWAEVDVLRKMGVEIKLSHVVGKLGTVDSLLGEYDAVFIGTGAGLPYFMGIPGENLTGIFSANEFLTRNNLMRSFEFPEYDTPIVKVGRVAVIGGGNVAMDSARTALRLGADKVYNIYRRSRPEMPARDEEIERAGEEGVDFRLLHNPVQYLGSENGRVVSMECIRMELGEPDESGRRRPIPIEGSEFTIDVDTVVVAIGNSPNPLIPRTTPSIRVGRKGNIEADTDTGKTSKKGVFAAGDIVLGAATVILAMGHARNAAAGIEQYLQTGGW